MDIPLARTRLDRFVALQLLALAVLLTALVALVVALLDGTARTVVLLVLVVAWLLQVGAYLFTWSQVRRVASPLGLHGDGLHGRSPFGEVVVPWEAVASAKVERTWRGRLLRVRLVPPEDPRHAAISDGTGVPRVLRTIDKNGMRYSLRVLGIDEVRLREAFVVQSGGRVLIG